jgi:predicted esterase
MMPDRKDSSNPTHASDYPEDFYTLQRQIFELYNRGEYREALTLAGRAATRFPGKDYRTTYWRACLSSRVGELGEALRVLNDATRRGLWWSEEALKLETDLDPIRSRSEFRTFLAECNRLKQAAGTIAKTQLIVLTPTNYFPEKVWPLLIALHPRGEDFEEFTQLWSQALSKGVLVALPRSSQPFSSHSRCWDDLARSEREVVDAYLQLNSRYKINQERIILSGFSQGATLAIYLALKGSLPARGFVAIAPASTIMPSHSNEFASFVRAAKNPASRGWILVGDNDRFFERINVLHSSMKQNGLESEYIVEKGLGHDYPDDFVLKLGRALDFVLS